MNDSAPEIVSVERIDGGVQIAFSNGREAFYPHALLYEVIDRASQPWLDHKLELDPE